jgi:Peptidase U49
MVFDLLCMGAAYCFLHEIKHVMFKSSISAIEPHDEEMQCDAFAREFLLGNIAAYSQESGYDIEAIKTKRAMSIGLTSLLLMVLTPNNQWFGTNSHPPIVDRITALIKYLELSEGNYFWSYLSCIILLVMERSTVAFTYPAISSQKEFCMFLMEKLNESI